ncbi:hypothetical protein P343_11715 [Sporolactobacillus laevolacticus DSM 442]|uniref:Uncharacterized protein n=1 Tax=Sporolactobacillus laevolacticus DSM 442 TaxID=1395513 RepID=V6IXS3_9BACL|nr:hypothetical protein P343_11715 [Sporolactobacillus laevolacticus DSM 442]
MTIIRMNLLLIIATNVIDFAVSCYLEGGTTYEKNIFTDCISGRLSPIDNFRYLLLQKNNWFRLKK